ncbi:uncharacterized protein CLUP02_15767 [Colletotrichum lupini]|uniref:Uncharacterized protein n=1 Tax=Colletotrichum lupini TaxID=145971 RepID=A0A9Q8T6V5_9PEZI|nr:uncharacterized protein CLUP02_15767 [Colletotrichum lupini]UQC90237.1 hypothetical protein CLUP02_15767 [Colletotrichum lupini]
MRVDTERVRDPFFNQFRLCQFLGTSGQSQKASQTPMAEPLRRFPSALSFSLSVPNCQQTVSCQQAKLAQILEDSCWLFWALGFNCSRASGSSAKSNEFLNSFLFIRPPFPPTLPASTLSLFLTLTTPHSLTRKLNLDFSSPPSLAAAAMDFFPMAWLTISTPPTWRRSNFPRTLELAQTNSMAAKGSHLRPNLTAWQIETRQPPLGGTPTTEMSRRFTLSRPSPKLPQHLPSKDERVPLADENQSVQWLAPFSALPCLQEAKDFKGPLRIATASLTTGLSEDCPCLFDHKKRGRAIPNGTNQIKQPDEFNVPAPVFRTSSKNSSPFFCGFSHRSRRPVAIVPHNPGPFQAASPSAAAFSELFFFTTSAQRQPWQRFNDLHVVRAISPLQHAIVCASPQNLERIQFLLENICQ